VERLNRIYIKAHILHEGDIHLGGFFLDQIAQVWESGKTASTIVLSGLNQRASISQGAGGLSSPKIIMKKPLAEVEDLIIAAAQSPDLKQDWLEISWGSEADIKKRDRKETIENIRQLQARKVGPTPQQMVTIYGLTPEDVKEEFGIDMNAPRKSMTEKVLAKIFSTASVENAADADTPTNGSKKPIVSKLALSP
jgi:hypothetical protein